MNQLRALGLPAILTIICALLMITIVGTHEDGILAALTFWPISAFGLLAMATGIKTKGQYWLLFAILPLGGSLVFSLLVLQACPQGICQ